jgi:hypothetical protein
MAAARTEERRRRRVSATAGRDPRKVVVDFPEPLFRETANWVAELSTTRSNFIRQAVEAYIRDRRQQKLREQLIEGYYRECEGGHGNCGGIVAVRLGSSRMPGK